MRRLWDGWGASPVRPTSMAAQAGPSSCPSCLRAACQAYIHRCTGARSTQGTAHRYEVGDKRVVHGGVHCCEGLQQSCQFWPTKTCEVHTPPPRGLAQWRLHVLLHCVPKRPTQRLMLQRCKELRAADHLPWWHARQRGEERSCNGIEQLCTRLVSSAHKPLCVWVSMLTIIIRVVQTYLEKLTQVARCAIPP